MTGHRWGRSFIPALFIILLAWPTLAPAEDTGGKIKVIVENATLRIKPAMDAERLAEGIPLGTVFKIEKKIGEWYEVKYQSKMGVMITGYIHEMYAEVLTAEPQGKPAGTPRAQEPKTIPAAPSKYRLVLDTSPKFEFGLGFGLGLGTFMPDTSHYSYSEGPIGVFQNITQSASVGHKIKNPLSLGLSFNYYLLDGLGLELRVDVNFKQTLDASQSDYSITWTQTIPPYGPISEAKSWNVTGDMSVLPISLDVIYKLARVGTFQPYVNAGLSLFTGTVNVSTSTGYKLIREYGGIPYLDYFIVPLKIQDASLGSVGFNAGLGADIHFSPNIGLNLDAVYFLGKSFDLTWTPVPGTYPATLNPSWQETLTQEELKSIPDHLGPLKVSTSFFKVTLGLKVGF